MERSRIIRQATTSTVILNEVKNLPDSTGNPAPTKKQHPKTTTPKKSTDAHLIDELFRQATELFE